MSIFIVSSTNMKNNISISYNNNQSIMKQRRIKEKLICSNRRTSSLSSRDGRGEWETRQISDDRSLLTMICVFGSKNGEDKWTLEFASCQTVNDQSQREERRYIDLITCPLGHFDQLIIIDDEISCDQLGIVPG